MNFTPAEFILARSEAFSRGDFGFIYDSYHSESNFLRQFVDRNEYIEFGKASLSQDYKISSCRILDQKVNADEAQVVFLMEMKVHDTMQSFAELAWLRCENNTWLYHRGLKISSEDLPDDPKGLSFEDFAKLDHATVF